LRAVFSVCRRFLRWSPLRSSDTQHPRGFSMAQSPTHA
jgi:hypothetical protein